MVSGDPALIVLTFLWIAFWMLTVFAFFAILITGRYPRGVFDSTWGDALDVACGVLRVRRARD